MNRAFKYIVVTLSTLAVALILGGTLAGQNRSQTPETGTPYRHLSVYAEVLAKIKSDYVEEPDMKNVTLGAINGLLVSIDPFASYLSAEQYKQYSKAKEQKRAGVGLVLSRKYGYEINIVDAIPGSPADKAGLSTGDILESLNGIQTRDMPLAFADLLLEGEPGTTVDLTVLRLRKPDPTTIKLTRAELKPAPITSKMVDDQTGMIQARNLVAGRTSEIAAAVKSLTRQGAKRLVLDLRHCSVSSVEEGIALANLFMDKGTIATLQGQKYPKKTFDADPSKEVFVGPLVILTNRGTLGAAEVAAAALSEGKRAQVVGERTFGDAALRKEVPTEDGGAVLLAVAKYYTPSGKSLQENPVTPAYLVNDVDGDSFDEDEEETAVQPSTAEKPKKSGDDAVLKKALDVLNGTANDAAKTDAQKAQTGAPLPKVPNMPPNH